MKHLCRYMIILFAIVLTTLHPWHNAMSSPTSLLSIILPDVIIKTPESNLPQEIRDLSGKWAGTWTSTYPGDTGRLDAALIVVEIKDRENASIILAAGDCPAWNVRKGFWKYNSKVTSTSTGPVMTFASRNRSFIFRYDKATETLSGMTTGSFIDMQKIK